MNSETHASVRFWEALNPAEQEPFLREAEDYVRQSIEHGEPSEIAPEESADAVLQAAREIYYETRVIPEGGGPRPGFTNAAIQEQARRVSLALHKRVYAYREPEGALCMTAAPSSKVGVLVAVYEQGRRLGRAKSGGIRTAPAARRELRISP